ncbi:MAG TPA: hypothetical protein VNF68_07875, partial [Candidatus Baltobacteraceae bacterium]|nr:hypothetical protein [Candidatus Baltobacteraceae bacterium]
AGIRNPVGGGGSAGDGNSKHSALTQALSLIEPGSSYKVFTADAYGDDKKLVASNVKLGTCAHAPQANPRGCFLCRIAEAMAALDLGVKR